jgi:hypothetical protein
MKNIKITLTEQEAQNLLVLVLESGDTGNADWDEIMKSIKKKIQEKFD